jgi:putative ubiquitin-RnfH superfamily antitoxin RatB of RatAB toxin-antitoxin module
MILSEKQKRMFNEHFLKLKTQVALEQAERKKRKLEASRYTFPLPSPSAKSSSSSRPKSLDLSSDSEHENESTWDATNGAMHEIYLNLKNKRMENKSMVTPDSLNAKDRVELLKFLLIDGNITAEQKVDIMKQLCSIAGI